MIDFLRLLTGRIGFERKARLLAAELGQQSAQMRRASGYTGCDPINEAEVWLAFLLTGRDLRQ